jgi:hypothetical protein
LRYLTDFVVLSRTQMPQTRIVFANAAKIRQM